MEKTKTILIIEQEASLTDGLKPILEKDNYRAISVPSFYNPKELFEVSKPDLAIIDAYMPKEFGLNILRKARESFPGLPIIVMTIYSDSFTIEELSKFGADDFLVKPFDVEYLKNKIEELTSNRKPISDKEKC